MKKKIKNKIRKNNKIKIWKKLRIMISYLIKKIKVTKLKILICRRSKIISKANQNKSKISQHNKKLIKSIPKIWEVIIIEIITEENIGTQKGKEVIPITTINITSGKMKKLFSYEMTNIYKKDQSKINKLIRISLKTLKIRYRLNQINFIVNIPKITNISHLVAEEEEDGVEEAHIINKIIQDPSIILKIIETIMAKKGVMRGIEKVVDGRKRMKDKAFIILINIIMIIIIIIIIIINDTIVMIIIKITINKIIKITINKIIKITISRIIKMNNFKIINSNIIKAKEEVMEEDEKEEEEKE